MAQCARIQKNDEQCQSYTKDGNKYCGRCLNFLKRSTLKTLGGELVPATAGKTTVQKKELAARKLLREIMDQNDIHIEIREWETDFNPFNALLDIAQEQMQWKDLCLAKISKLKEDEWRWDGDRAGEQMRSEISLYERAVDRATKTLERIARLGIEDKLMRIAERQAAIVETAIVRTIQDLDLPVELQVKARRQMVIHLRAVKNVQ